MTSSFKLSLYLSTAYHYDFGYPVDSNEQNDKLRKKLRLTNDEFKDWKPDWKLLPMYERRKFLKALSNEFSYVSESHQCREVVMSKGEFYATWQTIMNMVYKTSYLTLTYPDQIPGSFKEVVTSALLKPYAVNMAGSHITCNLDDFQFSIGMHPSYWNNAWLSMLTYFAKYGEYMYELAVGRYGTKDQYSLDQTICVILDSWSGQVGMYTAFGLWLWAHNNVAAIRSNYNQFYGIHSAMDHFSTLYIPDELLVFVKQYDLGLHRVSKLFLDNHKARCESAGLIIPNWYEIGNENDHHLAESPEWNDYMGYYDEDDEYYEDDDDYDFEEDW